MDWVKIKNDMAECIMCQFQLTIQISIFPNAPYFVPFALSNTRQLYLSREEFLLSLDVLTRDIKKVIVAFNLRNMYPAIMAIIRACNYGCN